MLLENQSEPKRHWLGLSLQGSNSNRDAIGAKVKLRTGKRELVRWLTGGSSYLATSDKRVILAWVIQRSQKFRWRYGGPMAQCKPSRIWKSTSTTRFRNPRQRRVETAETEILHLRGGIYMGRICIALALFFLV